MTNFVLSNIKLPISLFHPPSVWFFPDFDKCFSSFILFHLLYAIILGLELMQATIVVVCFRFAFHSLFCLTLSPESVSSNSTQLDAIFKFQLNQKFALFVHCLIPNANQSVYISGAHFCAFYLSWNSILSLLGLIIKSIASLMWVFVCFCNALCDVENVLLVLIGSTIFLCRHHLTRISFTCSKLITIG